MENASDALIMAGQVLIFIIALTVCISSFSSIRIGIDNVIDQTDTIKLAKDSDLYINFIIYKMHIMKELKFEDAMKELENIAKELEEGNLSLEDSVSKFEEGMMISKKCSEIIENAEKKISILLQRNGKIEEENFEVQD